jgi:GxxExxY protein
MNQNKLIYAEEAYEIQGAIFEVYKVIGCGFLEAVYQECLEKEFTLQDIPFESQIELKIDYKGQILKQTYKPDFICFDKIIVEIKAVKELTKEHQAQVINYLKATDMRLGLLVNFGSYPKVEIKRLINL